MDVRSAMNVGRLSTIANGAKDVGSVPVATTISPLQRLNIRMTPPMPTNETPSAGAVL